MMNSLNIRMLYALLVSFLLVMISCTPAYVPNVINTPLFKEQGEIQAAIHTGVSGTDPQFAYSVTDNFGVMLNSSFANREYDSTDSYHKHSFVELGGGYYTSFLDNGHFEVFGGYGFGTLDARFKTNLFNSVSKVNSSRFFLQPAVGARSSIFDGSFSPRLVLLNLYTKDESVTAFYLEPAITAKIGYKYVKAVFQFGLSLPLSESATYFYSQPILFSVGLQGFIPTKKDQSLY